MLHKDKMELKKARRAKTYERQQYAPVYVPANLSRLHPDFGMSMTDHEIEKAKRQNIS